MAIWQSSTKSYERRYLKINLKSVQRNATQNCQSKDSAYIKCSDVSHIELN